MAVAAEAVVAPMLLLLVTPLVLLLLLVLQVPLLFLPMPREGTCRQKQISPVSPGDSSAFEADLTSLAW